MKKQSMWLSVSCYGSTPPPPPRLSQRLLCWPRCTGHCRSLLGPSVLGKGSLKAEPNKIFLFLVLLWNKFQQQSEFLNITFPGITFPQYEMGFSTKLFHCFWESNEYLCFCCNIYMYNIDIYNIPVQCTYDKTLFPSHVQKTIYNSFDVTTMLKNW